MNDNRTELLRPARRGVYERLSLKLATFLERERRANQANWLKLEDEKLTEARLALFGSAPK